MRNKKEKIALITGSAGFIGYHISKKLLAEGWRVLGLDCLSDYYDVSLKESRENILKKYPKFRPIRAKVEERGRLLNLFEEEKPNIVIHLAAQAGVRYSIENPRSYLESNIIGTFELLEAARIHSPDHILLASTSSVYGANTKVPYKEVDRADHQMSFYAATKKSAENMAHSYSHLFDIPITVFRFFTVYGPWGRPDMALFKFTEAILKNEVIDVYNHGEMRRDFTYIDDLVQGIHSLISSSPNFLENDKKLDGLVDSKSPVASFRIVNIGNSNSVKLTDFINALEKVIGIKAKKNFLPMQPGDVVSTWADNSLLKAISGKSSFTNVEKGIKSFIKWYRTYYRI